MFNVDIREVKPLPQRHLQLTFEDGLQATVALDQIVHEYTGVFAPLLDADFFNQVQVVSELGTIAWPNGADVCPDVLYSLACGKPLLDMEVGTHGHQVAPKRGSGPKVRVDPSLS